MTCPPGRTIWYTVSEGAAAEPLSPLGATGQPIAEARQYQPGSPLLIRRSPTRIKAVCIGSGVQPGIVSTGEWWTRGTNARMGEAINRPLNADVTTNPPVLLLQPGGFDEEAAGTPPNFEERKLANWSPFAYLANAPDPFSPNPSQPRFGVVFGSADNKPGKIDWWIPEFNTFVEFDHISLPPNQDDAVQIYHTTEPAPPIMQVLLPTGVTESIIHYNDLIARRESVPIGSPASNFLWITPSPTSTEQKRLNAARREGYVLMSFKDGREPTAPFGGVQVVQLKEYKLDPPNNLESVAIGSELRPRDVKPRISWKNTWATVGLDNYIYQHKVPGSPFEGRVFAVRKAGEHNQMEVIWTQTDRLRYGTIWPYEIRRYAADWPASPQKYVISKRTSGLTGTGTEPLGPAVRLPSPKPGTAGVGSGFATLMDYQEQADGSGTKHALIAGMDYTATKPGRATIRYSTRDRNGDDWVGFQVIETVWRDDAAFDLTERQNPIGLEIKGPEIAPGVRYHEAPWPAHLHVYDTNWDEYLPAVYGHDPTMVRSVDTVEREKQFNRGQLFAVNRGKFEAWWFNRFRPAEWPDEMAVYWPSTVTRHNNHWPSAAAAVDIASQCGTGAINADLRRWYIYWQNDAGAPGFNPNDEHAIRWPVQNGEGAFALRNDLGSAATSEPWLLLPYQVADSLDSDWNMLVYRVTAGEFRYLGKAGTSINPPLPLNSFTDLVGREVVSGPVWTDRKNALWAAAAGNSGTNATATATIRYFYRDRPDQGFFYPAGYSGRPAAAGGSVPWLDVLARQRNANHPSGKPIDINYTIRWPDGAVPTDVPPIFEAACAPTTVVPQVVPTLLFGETYFTRDNGLPEVENQKSVEILYQQSVANGRGKSAEIIDPTRKRYLNGVLSLPRDVKRIPYKDKVFFEVLPPHLQSRFWYEPTNQRLVFEGRLIRPSAGDPYAQLNVLSSRDRTHLLAISTDGAFRDRLSELFAAAAEPIVVPSQGGPEVDSYAVTAGNAKGSGYVTLAFGADPSRNQDADPVALHIIKVEPPLHTGEVRPVYPATPFDEMLTLRHSGDFLGKPEEFEFEWRFRPNPLPTAVSGSMNSWPTNYRADEWTDYPTATGETSLGRQEIVIRGANPNTLSDNWFICRYRPKNPAHPLRDQWSAWTKPQLAEGWIKRVLAGITPFDQRYGSRPANAVNTMVSMISQAGRQWEGQIPFVADPADVDSYGLIEIYESVLNRGLDFSVNGTPPIDFAPMNQALMLAAGRISDLYMLLGNEAYADAANPTIGFGTADGKPFSAFASSLFCFKNQFSDLLGEELGLLRGRDDTGTTGTRTAPWYNRLPWNLTRDITGGEVAYVLNYAIRDNNWSRSVPDDATYNELVAAAARDYPQGHGDAWGHYLSALKVYQRLMANPNFSWVPAGESVIVAGQPVSVDYYDERKFAATAAAKAKTGAEIVNLTYRERYTEDPSGQAANFTDTNGARSWGVNDWAMRAGQGAYIDWVVGNAVLPDADPSSDTVAYKLDPDLVPEFDQNGRLLRYRHRLTGVTFGPAITPAMLVPVLIPGSNQPMGRNPVNRSTVVELGNIPSAYTEVQAQIDAADSGLNPLGVSKNAVPFDISPADLSGTAPKTHFEQIYDRAVTAMNNAIAVFDFAYSSAQHLRTQADTVADFQQNVVEQEADFKSRLIEIFGYPYPDDIGNGKTYPDGYDGPDLYHFAYFEPSELLGRREASSKEVELDTLTGELKRMFGGALPDNMKVKFNFSTAGFGLVRPRGWTRPRRAQGEIQLAHSEIMQAWGRFRRAVREYDNLLGQIEDQGRVIAAQEGLNRAEQAAGAAEVAILTGASQKQESLNDLIMRARQKQISYQNKATYTNLIGNAIAEQLPQSFIAGLANGGDLTSTLRSAIRIAQLAMAQSFSEQAQDEQKNEQEQQQAKEMAQAEANIRVVEIRNGIIDDRGNAALAGSRAQLQQLLRTQAILTLDIYAMDAALEQATNRYLAALARGLRLLEDQERFQAKTASTVQQYRYKDMAFRIFRDDALQKYRAQFDLAARYVYLAAKAYDYETGLLDSDSRAAQRFLTQIVRSRALGAIVNGRPLTGGGGGDPGLADAMAQMAVSWDGLKTQLGFNNPSNLRFQFSLRQGNYRLANNSDGNEAWRQVLQTSRVTNMLDVEEFRRFCLPPQGSSGAPEPAIILPFTTSINNGRNFFGWPLGGGDMAFPSTHFAVKIKAAGACFVNYDASPSGGLAATPYVYLVPAGVDTQRVPRGDLPLRSWQVLDQIIPRPGVLGGSLLNDPDYIPQVDSLGQFDGAFGNLRRLPQMLACHDFGGAESPFNPNSPNIWDSRLVGRSVWNSRWLLIIPGRALNGSNPQEGLDQFIGGRRTGSGSLRTGNGVSDIRLLIDAYSYRGILQ